jgi:ketosteroid isomerase-like protein
MNCKHSLFAALGSALASLTLGCSTPKPPLEEEVHKLVDLSRESNAALLRGDAERYGQMLKQAEDFTLMSPFGGKPTHGAAPPERMREIGKFFKNGKLEQELVQAYSSPDLVVLATIERAHVEVGGLPAQDWALRVTLVYRREGSEWHLAHRHADPLANAITLPEAAALGRGAHATGG